MSRRELAAADIEDPALCRSYETCRRLFAKHGRTFYLATRLLPPRARPPVHALYGFARWADEIVDDIHSPLSVAEKRRRLDGLGHALDHGEERVPVVPAVRHTITAYDLEPAWFTAFLDSMRMDLAVTGYPTYADLMAYVHGSAEVIGLQMAVVLGHPGVPRGVVAPYARDLGTAFQLINFIRDVGEDFRRGRVYLPAEDLTRFGVDRERLGWRRVDGPVRELLAYETTRARGILATARLGIRLLDPAARPAIATATTLYGGILDEVERAGFQVLDRRVSVGLPRRLRVAGPALIRTGARRVSGPALACPATPTSTR